MVAYKRAEVFLSFRNYIFRVIFHCKDKQRTKNITSILERCVIYGIIGEVCLRQRDVCNYLIFFKLLSEGCEKSSRRTRTSISPDYTYNGIYCHILFKFSPLQEVHKTKLLPSYTCFLCNLCKCLMKRTLTFLS
jgi:hypothetical protein